MCTVLLRFTPGGPYPLLFGAVRDEFVDRAWDPPAAHWSGHMLGGHMLGGHVIGGRDRTAGGTWLAVDPAAPAVAAVLNGVRLPVRGARPSRGGLPLAALRGEVPARPEGYDGFHLVLGTPAAVTVWSWDGAALTVRDLAPGDHLIVNEGVDPDRPVVEKLHAAEGHDDWQRLLGDDLVLVDREHQGRRYGSTSTSLVTLAADGVRYEFNPTPRQAGGWYDVPTGGGAAPRPTGRSSTPR